MANGAPTLCLAKISEKNPTNREKNGVWGILAFRMSLLNTSMWTLMTEQKCAIFLFRAIFGHLDFLFRFIEAVY